MPWGPNGESDTKRFLRDAVAAQRQKPRIRYELAVTLGATGDLIGGCSVEVRLERKEGTIGYVFNKNYWGKGYATETVQALVAFGFTRLALHRIAARCEPENIASNKVLKKAGMRFEGCMRENFPIRSKWRDSNLYGMLEREWDSRKRVLPP